MFLALALKHPDTVVGEEDVVDMDRDQLAGPDAGILGPTEAAVVAGISVVGIAAGFTLNPYMRQSRAEATASAEPRA